MRVPEPTISRSWSRDEAVVAPSRPAIFVARPTSRSGRPGLATGVLGFGLLVTSCAAQSTMAKAQDAAQELNMNARYGRNEIAIERVAPRVREQFSAHHRAWGGRVRIADIELEGSHANGDHDVEMMVRVAWYRPEEEDLRSTTLKQSWHDQNGWQLVGEERVEGDLGLLGETVVFEAPVGPKPPTQFPTVKLGAPTP